MTTKAEFFDRIRAEMARTPGRAPSALAARPVRPREGLDVLRRELSERWRENLDRFQHELERVGGVLHRVAEAGEVPGLTSALVPLPLAHAYGLLVACMGLHRSEPGRTILMRWFDPAGWLDLAVAHRVHRTALVPSMIQMLLALPLEEHDLSALVAVSSGAAPLAAEVRERFEARVPGARI